jgi:hypothetical protein
VHAEKALALAEAVVHDPSAILAEEDWDRVPDQTLLKVTCQALVEKVAVTEALGSWLAEAGANAEQYSTTGPLLGRRFSVKFSGEPHLAARRVRKAATALRSSDGIWREFTVKSPGGEPCRLYVSEDKSARVVQVEMATKRLQRAIVETSGVACHMVKKDGVVTTNLVPLAKIDATCDGECQILWHGDALAKTTVSKEKVLEHFAASAKGRAATSAVQWCL